MFDNIKKYLNDDEWRIHIYDQKINIVNYIDIITLEDNRISIKYQNGIIVIKGKKLSVNKMLDNEILITGIIDSVEFE
ncbi:MAG: YabP/YqfC family sporulation protein [Bacilli bacterium]|nr:YabP/YqfC family sporulation protein [Bacilli bacterium]